MNKYLLFYMLIILFVGLIACNGQNRESLSENDVTRIDIELPDSLFTIERIDTILITNAPTRITRKIRKGKGGNLLLAAFNDIIQYDGASFSNIPKADGFESFDAFDALEDSKGDIWIASTHYGIFHYDGKNFRHFTTDDGLVHNRTMGLYEDSKGNVWITTMGGVSCYDGKSFRNYTTEKGLTHNDVNTMIEDNTGKIWFGTRGTACVYDPLKSVFTEITRNDGTAFTNIWSIIEDQQGNIWIGGENGLWRYDGSSFVNFTTAFVNCIFEDKKGNIWTTSPKGLLSCYKVPLLPNEKTSSVVIFRSNSMFFSGTEDQEGYIWIGTLNGVFRYDGKSINFFKNTIL